MSNHTMICKNCNQEFEQKNNQIVCPHCGSLLPLEELELTEIDVALQYIVRYSGPDVLKNKGRVLSMLPDIFHGSQEDLRLLRYIYQISEKEIATYVNAASKQKNLDSALPKLLRAWNAFYIENSYMDKAAVIFLKAYDLDPEQYLGGTDHSTVTQLSHRFHRDEFIKALQEVKNQGQAELWKTTDTLAGFITDANSSLKEEAKLLRAMGVCGQRETTALLNCIFGAGYHENDEKLLVAELQSKLSAGFMGSKDIDYVMEAVLEAAGLQYTQKRYHPQVSTGTTTQGGSVRPRKGGSVGGGTGAGTGAGGGNTSGGATGTGGAAGIGTGGSGTGTAGGTTRTGTGGTSVSNGATGTGGTSGTNGTTGAGGTSNNTGTSGTGSGRHKKKKKFSLGKLIFYILICYVAYTFLIRPAIVSRQAEKAVAIAESEAESRRQEETVPAETEPEDPYPAPSVGTSDRQGGLYKEGNLATPSRYGVYQGPEKDFKFSYPRVLYNDVSYIFENDGDDIDIAFTCPEDPSSLTVSIHPTDGQTDTEELKNTLMQEIKNSMTNPQVLDYRQSMTTSLADTRSSMAYTFRIQGQDAADSNLMVVAIVRVKGYCVEKMILKYPQPTDSTDKAIKEYYAQSMNDLCGFGGNREYESWSKYKKAAGLQ